MTDLTIWITPQQVREWLDLDTTHKMRHMAYHAMQTSEKELMPFVDLAESYVAAMQNIDDLRMVLQRIAMAAESNSPDAHYLGNLARKGMGLPRLPKKEPRA